MSTSTTYLDLFKYDSEKDAKQTFNINTALNENWDKIDNFAAQKGNVNGYASLDGNGKVPLAQLPELKNGISLPLFTPIIMDHALSFESSKGYALQGTYVYKEAVAGSRYGYPDFYQKCVDEKNNAVQEQMTIGSTTITVYKNANGHIFYDISDKSAVDNLFNTTGVSDMYGVDEENERIFLPRSNWFMQLTTDISKVNDYNKPGLPNHTHPIQPPARNSAGSIPFGGGGGNMGFTNETEEVENSDIYGASDTVQPPSSNKLLYYVVGNTVQEEAITNVIDITTSENDTIPLGFSTYQNGAQPSAAWLKSQGQWNSGNIYQTFYNYAVNKLGDTFASGYIKSSTTAYNDYDLVINEENMTFRLPLLNGSERILSNSYENITLLESGSQYQVEKSGRVELNITAGATNEYANLINWTKQSLTDEAQSTYNGARLTVSIEVAQNDTFVAWYDTTGPLVYFRLYPFKGNGTLYFKVSNAVQNLELLDAAEVTEALADKLDISQVKAYITESYLNGLSGYNLYSNGFCEQWGSFTTTAASYDNITLLKPFINTNYFATYLFCNQSSTSDDLYVSYLGIPRKSPSNFSIVHSTRDQTISGKTMQWYARGYIN